MGLEVKDICEIIRVGHRFGVSELEAEGVYIRFSPKDPDDSPTRGQASPKLSAKQREIVEKTNDVENLEENEFKTRQEHLSFLRLADPEAYEDLIARGELENAGQEPEGA